MYSSANTSGATIDVYICDFLDESFAERLSIPSFNLALGSVSAFLGSAFYDFDRTIIDLQLGLEPSSTFN